IVWWSAWSVISATCRSFDTLRITCASTGRRRYFFTRSSFSSAYERSAGVGSRWRKVTRICMGAPPRCRGRSFVGREGASGIGRRSLSVNLLPLRRGQDTHQPPVIGDRPPGDVDLFLAEQLGDVLVAEGLLRVLLGDDLPDLLLHTLRAHLRALPAAEARGEEVLELEGALRGVHVLARGRPADGRLVHADVVRDVLQDEWAEERHAALEELLLELHDARGDHVERPLPLMDRLDEPGGGPHLLLDVAPRLGR